VTGYELARTVLQALPDEALERRLDQLKSWRMRSYVFQMNGRATTLTRAEAKSLMEEEIRRRSATGTFAKESHGTE
jgi:hypothetical protein